MHGIYNLRWLPRTVVRLCVVMSFGAALLVPLQALAGNVILGGSGWAASWDASLDPYVGIVVKAENATQVFIEKSAEFTQAPGPGGMIPPIPINFQRIAPNAVSQIVILQETITNNSGVAWTGFQMTLVQGASPIGQFNPGLTNNSAAGLGFYTSPLSNNAFPDNLTFLIDGFGQGPGGSNAVISNGATWLPGDDLQAGSGGELYIDVQTSGSSVFTLKETPTIPEPSGIVLIFLGVIVLCAMGRRRWR